MDVLSYSDTRANLKKVMDRVVDDHAPVVISRQGGKPVVLVSLEDWHAIEEMLHLRSSPLNEQRLNEAIAELDAGGGTEHKFVDA